jgi:PAS domain S-box-containing protein
MNLFPLIGADVALVLGLAYLMDRSRRKAKVKTDQANTRTEAAEARVEQGLRDSELRYRRTFETAQDGILILDGATGQVVDANPIMKVLLGYSQEEIVGRKLWEIGPFKGTAASKLTFAELQNEDRIYYEALPLEAKDGRQVEVEFISNTFLVGQKRLIQCNIRDLTERKQAEHQLLLLRICVSHFNDIVLITEAEPIKGLGRKIVFVNEAFHRITGYTAQEAIGRTPQFLQGPKTDPVVVAEIHHALRQHKPIRRQLINYRKDGSEYWMDIDIVPIFDPTGKCTYFSAIQRDITEERKSAESLNLFRTLMDRSPDAIEVIDPDTGRILDVNATGCRRLGYTREEMLELNLSDIVQARAGSQPFSMEKSGEEIRRIGFKSFEGLHRRKDRSVFPIEVNVQYIQLNRGYLIAVVRDITERKKLENEFLRAQRMESIGTLAGGIAHDLNNILAPIMIAIEVLKLAATDPQAKTILQTIEVSAKRGAGIVRQVLSFARGMEGEKRPLELGALLRELETIIKDTFPKDIVVQFVFPTDLWLVLADPTQINQVLLNLCVNGWRPAHRPARKHPVPDRTLCHPDRRRFRDRNRSRYRRQDL